MLIGLLCALN